MAEDFKPTSTDFDKSVTEALQFDDNSIAPKIDGSVSMGLVISICFIIIVIGYLIDVIFKQLKTSVWAILRSIVL